MGFGDRLRGRRRDHDQGKYDRICPATGCPGRPIRRGHSNTLKRKILVVDDESDVRELLAHLLSREYAVISAENGAEGVRLFKRHKPHAVLLDIKLSDMRGTDVLRSIRKADARAVVLMLSSYADMKTMRETLAYGASGYLCKPFNCALLKDALGAALRGPGA